MIGFNTELLKDYEIIKLEKKGRIFEMSKAVIKGYSIHKLQRMDAYIMIQPEIIHRSLKFLGE